MAFLVAIAFFVYGGATVVSARRSLNRFAIERGGIVRALRRTTEYPLDAVDRAELEAGIGSKYELYTRVIITTRSGERIALAQEDSPARNRDIVEKVNRFLTGGQSGVPAVQDVFRSALKKAGGTVMVYADARQPNYLLFPVSDGGLMYFWKRAAIEVSVGGSLEDTVAQILREAGVANVQVTPAGVSAPLGTDVDRAESVARAIFKKLWKTDASLSAAYNPASYTP